jgi:hypothetical protein
MALAMVFSWPKHGWEHQRWKKYLYFCQPGLMRRKLSAKTRDLRQHVKDTKDLFEENKNFT